jgi:uncharacterized membrane protein
MKSAMKLTDPFSLTSLIVTSIIFMVIILAFAVGLATLFGAYEKRKTIKEKRELQEELDNYFSLLQEETGNVVTLIKRNLTLLREAYVISKQQVRNIFSAALFTCCIGFIVFVTGIIAFSSRPNVTILVCSTIAGAVIEIIAGLMFWIYSKSLEQLNSFHKTFYENHKLLSSIHLVNNVSEMNKDALYAYIVQNTLNDGSPADFNFLINPAK